MKEHPILSALVDKRKKLEVICEKLREHNSLDKLYYGAGRYSVDFQVIEELLEATRGGG